MDSQPILVMAVNEECGRSVSDPRSCVGGQVSKALLIGIRGTETASEEYRELRGPHKDVANMRDLLIKCYNYLEDDITVLVDDGIPGNAQPTRDNILKAIDDLVKGAKEGDRFCFHYCGHSIQDGMDECLVPSDGADKHIVDNELNAALVMPLPAGCQLVAILDTCHSGTLLDLKHHWCNRVAVPWTSGGKRGCDEIRRRVVRSNARLLSLAVSGRKSVPSPPPSTCPLAKPAQPLQAPARSAPAHPARAPSPSRPTRNGDVPPALPGSSWFLPEEVEHPRCASPAPMFECDRWCRERDETAAEMETDSEDAGGAKGRVRADVISLASCEDSQVTYEDAEGNSMTSALVDILRSDPNQSLKDVLLSVSHAMHEKALIRHTNAKKYNRDFKALVARMKLAVNRRLFEYALLLGTFGYEFDMDNFENPVLASARPLDMGRRFQM
ncbi:caspase domain-containing protein [Mycena olivaceomarginata]|nr:caspase domain-containing protein [Mycena olivaceomarginata]